MDKDELLDSSKTLRGALRVWNGLCLVVATVGVVGGIALALSENDDDYIDFTGVFLTFAFLTPLVVGLAGLVGRLVLVQLWRAGYVLSRRGARSA
jgi:hypothetical protein